jgi:hypothetical protein
MKTIKTHRMRNAILVALLLLVGGALANMKTPVSSSLLLRALNREALSISRERNAGVLKSVFEVFDPSLRTFLASVPIVLDPSADTAKAYPAKGCIGVSPEWDNTVHQSKHRAIYEQRGMKPDDPVFMYRFKTDLLIHEFLHILQVQKKIDAALFCKAVARWYIDPRYGRPSPSGVVYADTTKKGRPDTLVTNRMKYVVWHELYNYRRLSDVPQDESWKNMQYGERYRSAEKGVDEFAYIGQEILSSGSSSENYIKTGQWCDKDWKNKKMRLLEVSPEITAVFKGVFNPALTQ